jgi:Tol biopolymer transport system component
MRAVLHRTLASALFTVWLSGLAACSPPAAIHGPTSTSAPATPPEPAGCGAPTVPVRQPIDIRQLTGRIAFSKSTDDIYVINANGTGLTRLTTDSGPEFDPSWSPDGTQIVYRDSRRGINQNDEIYVMNADGSGKRNLTNTTESDWGPAWSPDGRKIAFNSAHGPANVPMHGYTMNPDGSGLTLLGDASVEYPAWSPDSKRIVFMAQEPGASGSNPDYNIYVMNADGTGRTQLTNAPGEDGWPAWSPDGRKIAFASARCDTGQSRDIGPFFTLFLMNADGSEQTRLTEGFAQFVAWSPDGTKLVVAGECGGIGLCVINADGSGLTRLADGELLLPDWI